MVESPVAVITGAGRAGGIGRAIAKALLDREFRVVVSDLEQPMDSHPDYHSATRTELAQTVSDLQEHGEVIGIPCDVRDPESVEALYEATANQLGRIDVSVQNAGIAMGLTEVVNLSLADWQLNLDVMATGVFLCAQAAARRMIEQGEGGRIVNMSSQSGKTGMPLLGAYSAAKFAVLGLTQTMAHELGRYGITVNAVCPGTVLTPLLDVPGGVFQTYPKYLDMDPERYKRRLLRQIPVGRFAHPDDIARVVAFLASDDASYITGEAVNVTGGQEMH